MLRLFCDRRIKPDRYYLAETEETMLVPQQLLESVAFIYCKVKGKKEPVGTVFFITLKCQQIEDSGFPYAITARHTIETIKRHSDDDKVYFRINRRSGNTDFIEVSVKHWRFHPSDHSIDVAVLPFLPPSKTHDVLTMPDDIFITDERAAKDGIGIGDEVFITGLFVERLGKARNIPIVRIGNIAAMAGEPIPSKMGDITAHLIEARSIGGLSGSPVFVSLGNIRRIGGRVKVSGQTHPVFYLFGLVHGHYDETQQVGRSLTKEPINMGIALVVTMNHIREVLDHPALVSERQQMEDEAMAKKNLPSLDASQIARSVVEAAIGEPLTTPKKKTKTAKKGSKRVN